MVHDSFDSIFGVSNRQSNNDSTGSSHIVHHACSRYSILCKLVGEHIGKSVAIDVLYHGFSCFLHC